MSPSQKIHLLDNETAASSKLARFLEHFGYRVTRHASACELLEAVNDADYAVALLDHHAAAAAGLAESDIGCPVILMARNADIRTSVRAIKAGAVDFLEKPLDDAKLLTSIREAFREAEVSRQERTLRNIAHDRFDTLTPREQEVMQYVINGTSNQALARRLKVSIRTVEVHRSRVRTKMGAGSLAELVRLADLLEGPARQAHRPAPPQG